MGNSLHSRPHDPCVRAKRLRGRTYSHLWSTLGAYQSVPQDSAKPLPAAPAGVSGQLHILRSRFPWPALGLYSRGMGAKWRAFARGFGAVYDLSGSAVRDDRRMPRGPTLAEVLDDRDRHWETPKVSGFGSLGTPTYTPVRSYNRRSSASLILRVIAALAAVGAVGGTAVLALTFAPRHGGVAVALLSTAGAVSAVVGSLAVAVWDRSGFPQTMRALNRSLKERRRQEESADADLEERDS